MKKPTTEDRRRKGTKKSRGPAEPITVVFIPRTPGGNLLKALKEAEDKLGKACKRAYKVVEKRGFPP